jgi:cation diffusion facilitator family transporter
MAKKNGFSFIPEYGDTTDPVVRAKYGYLEGIVSIIGNSILFVIKLFLGVFLNSIALIADAFHTLGDSGTSAVVILGFKMAKKPPDKEHPFGHGRIEYIATLIVAILLFIAGISFIEQSIERFIHAVEMANLEYGLVIGIVIIISAFIKELLAQFSNAIGKKIKSDILIADAWHHRSDAIASVAVGLGIIGSSFGYTLLDPIFGLVVAGIIIYVGYDLIKSTSDRLIGNVPEEEVLSQIKKTVKSIDDVKGIEDISVHDYGSTKIVSLEVHVENDLPLDDAHEIADDIENRIKNKLNFSTIIHLEPKETHVDKQFSKMVIQNILKRQPEIISFHKIQVIRNGKSENIKMHVIVDKDMPIGVSHKFCHDLEELIQKEYGTCKVDIHLEPCEKDCKICTISCTRRTTTF